MAKQALLSSKIKKTETTEQFEKILVRRTVYSIPMYIEFFGDLYSMEFHIVRRISANASLKPVICDLSAEFDTYNVDWLTADKPKLPFYYTVKIFDKTGKEMPLFYSLLVTSEAYPNAISKANLDKLYKEWDNELLNSIYNETIDQKNPFIRFNMGFFLGQLFTEILSVAYDHKWADWVYKNYHYKKGYPKAKQKVLESALYMMLNKDDEYPDDGYSNFVEKINNIKDAPTRNYYHAVLDSFLKYIETNNIMTKCPCCGNYFLTKKNKKACSLFCRKSLANRRGYLHRKETNRTEYHNRDIEIQTIS